MNSFQRVVRRGLHEGFYFVEGRELGAVASISAVRAERSDENQWSSCLGEETMGAAGISHTLSLSIRPGQWAFSDSGLCLSWWGVGG